MKFCYYGKIDIVNGNPASSNRILLMSTDIKWINS